MKARPSGEKRRKEMLRLERNKDKQERRKNRKEDRQKRADGSEAGTPEEEPTAQVGDEAQARSGVQPSPPAASGGTAVAAQPVVSPAKPPVVTPAKPLPLANHRAAGTPRR